MIEIEICKKIYDKAKETFLSKLEDEIKERKEEHIKQEKLEEYYVSIIEDISEIVADEWESENVIDYVTKYAPIEVGDNYSIFSKDMRNEFIKMFYVKSSIKYKSEKIEKYLNNYLDELENYLDNMDLKDKLFYRQLDDLQRGLGRMEDIAKEILDKKSENDIEDRRIRRISKIRLSSFLKYYLNSFFQMYVLVEDDDFQEEITEIKTKYQNTWKSTLIRNISTHCKKKCLGFEEKISFIKSNQEYEIILQVAKDILDECEWNDGFEKMIREETRYPQFNKVFVVTGNMGTGKTYFVRKFIERNIEDLDTVIISLSNTNLLEEREVESIILRAANTVMDMESSSIMEFVKRMEKLNLKICIIIENIQVLYIKDKNKFLKLIEKVKLYTKYDNISWLFTVSEYDYYIFEEIPQFLKCYCFGTEMTEDALLKNSFSVKKYNLQHEIIMKILDYYRVEVIRDEYVNGMNLDKSIDNPLFAHILGECCKGEKLLAYPESYFDYIKIVVEMFNKKIGKLENREIIIEDEKKIFQIMRETGEIVFNNEKFQKLNRKSIDDLMILHLLACQERKNDDIYCFNQYIYDQEYTLKVEVYWAFRFILYCQSIADKGLESLNELIIFEKDFKDILLPCYLMVISENTDKTAKVIRELFLADEGYYALFCARQASLEYEKIVFEYLANNTLRMDTKTVYALLYYIHYSRLKIKEKLLLITKNGQNIVDSGLISIYENIFREIICTVNNEKSMRKNMSELIPCNLADLNVINGYICGSRYMAIVCDSGKTLYDGIKSLESFIWCNKEHLKQIKMDIGRNTSFMDFFLRGYYEACMRKNKLSVLYDYLVKGGYFKIKESIGHFFKRNFTCAAGNIYSKMSVQGTFKKEYEKLVYALTLSSDKEDNQTAIFLIFNSIDEKKGLSYNLMPSLKKLWEDPEIKEKYKNHKEAQQIFKCR